MSARYSVVGPWRTHRRCTLNLQDAEGNDIDVVICVQAADLRDGANGHVYTDGAYRVTTNGKVAKRGKNNDGPWFGETARSYAYNRYDAVVRAHRMGWKL